MALAARLAAKFLGLSDDHPALSVWPHICDVLMMHSSTEVSQAYRRLYRQGLHAVQYASPARHILRRQLDQAFREGKFEDFDAQRIANTVFFLECAAREKGLEHRILKTLLHQRWWEMQSGKRRSECVLLMNFICASRSVLTWLIMLQTVTLETTGYTVP